MQEICGRKKVATREAEEFGRSETEEDLDLLTLLAVQIKAEKASKIRSSFLLAETKGWNRQRCAAPPETECHQQCDACGSRQDSFLKENNPSHLDADRYSLPHFAHKSNT
jgi:hypothetical protein